MNLKLVGNSVSNVVLVLGVLMLIPLGVSLIYGESDAWAFAVSAAITTSCGFVGAKFTRSPEGRFGHREGFAITTFGWLAAAVFGALPFLFYGTFGTVVDAVFEAMSGLTTTGATVLGNIEAQPHGILFWRSFLHWLGGMGIVVLSIAILPSFQISGHQLFKAEVPGPVVERLEPRIRETAKKLWAIYAGLSVMETLLLWLFGMSLFDAVTHTFATMATGGFSTANRSIEAWSSPLIQFTITLFMLLAGANFALYFRALRGNFKSIKEDEEFKVYGAVILVGTALVWLNLMRDMGIAVFDGFRLALFQVTSILTTTGFTTADFGHWPSFSRTILVALMFIGGCAGSTGGSIKVVRILTVAKHSFRELVRAVHPRRVDVVKLNGRPVPESVLASVLGFVFLYFVIFFAGVGIMSMLGLELVCSFTAVAATLGNVGPGLGIVSPSSNYASIPYVGKWVLIFLMVTGRLELYTVLALLIPGFWRRRHSSAARSPHANMHADRSS